MMNIELQPGQFVYLLFNFRLFHLGKLYVYKCIMLRHHLTFEDFWLLVK